MSSAEIAKQIILNWKPEAFDGSSARNTIKPTIDSLQAMAKGLPLDIEDEDINSALKNQYPGSTHKRLFKNKQPLCTVNIHFPTPETKQNAIDNGLLIETHKMLFRIEPIHNTLNNHGS